MVSYINNPTILTYSICKFGLDFSFAISMKISLVSLRHIHQLEFSSLMNIDRIFFTWCQFIIYIFISPLYFSIYLIKFICL